MVKATLRAQLIWDAAVASSPDVDKQVLKKKKRGKQIHASPLAWVVFSTIISEKGGFFSTVTTVVLVWAAVVPRPVLWPKTRGRTQPLSCS